MENLVWRYNQYEKSQLYNPNTELFHTCDTTPSSKDYWICYRHKRALVIKPDRMFCPVTSCPNDVFIRKSYYDVLNKHFFI